MPLLLSNSSETLRFWKLTSTFEVMVAWAVREMTAPFISSTKVKEVAFSFWNLPSVIG